MDFQLDSFNKGDYMNAVEQENLAKNIVEVLIRQTSITQVRSFV